jgi:hypothetical protein
VFDTLEFLIGSWRVTRSLRDHRLAVEGSFEGSASISDTQPDCQRDEVAHYDETGEFRFSRHRGPARRTLIVRRADESRVMLFFADMRPFVDLDLSSGAWRGMHRCGNDLYEIATTMRSSDVFEEQWRVRGATKSYDAITTYRRVTIDPR